MALKFRIIILLLLTWMLTYSQENGQGLRGTLIDQVSHQPIPFANIVLSDQHVTSTNKEGEFRFSNLPIGVYHLKASYIGYESIEIRNLHVDSGKEAIYNLTMIESMETFKEVVIQLISVFGTKVIDRVWDNNSLSTHLDLSALNSGFYFINISNDDNHSITRKIIISK